LKPKLLIIGHGRHGKDTVCEMLRDNHGFNFQSSSKFCSEKFIYEKLKDKYNYSSELECYNDRHNHREEWYNLICEYNVPDPARLGKEIFQEYDIYCGLRNAAEYYAMFDKYIFDCVVWVDRSDHLPQETKDSMTLTEEMADYIIDNNGTLAQLKENVEEFLKVGA
jgi:hypothetical protein